MHRLNGLIVELFGMKLSVLVELPFMGWGLAALLLRKH